MAFAVVNADTFSLISRSGDWFPWIAVPVACSLGDQVLRISQEVIINYVSNVFVVGLIGDSNKYTYDSPMVVNCVEAVDHR